MIPCENLYCIYQKENLCRLGEICVNEWGMCGSCILLKTEEKKLEELKAQMIQELEKEDFDWLDD